MKRFSVRCKESGDNIESFNTLEEAKQTLQKYEEEDIKDKIYIPNFYEVYDNEKEEIL